jgi:hypothetical protein
VVETLKGEIFLWHHLGGLIIYMKYKKIAVILVCLLSFITYGCTSFGPAVEKPVPDGELILVNRGRAYGAFVLYNQTMYPEKAEYSCLWQTKNPESGSLNLGIIVLSGYSISGGGR